MFLAMFLRASALASALRPCGTSAQPLPMTTASTSEVGRYSPAGRIPCRPQGRVYRCLCPLPTPETDCVDTSAVLCLHAQQRHTCGKGAKRLQPGLGPDAGDDGLDAVHGRLPLRLLLRRGRQVAAELDDLCRDGAAQEQVAGFEHGQAGDGSGVTGDEKNVIGAFHGNDSSRKLSSERVHMPWWRRSSGLRMPFSAAIHGTRFSGCGLVLPAGLGAPAAAAPAAAGLSKMPKDT